MRTPDAPRRRRILFVGQAVSLAHVARPLRLAQELDRSAWEVHFACDERYRRFVAQAEMPFRALASMAPDEFRQRLARGAALADGAALAREIEADTALLEELRPDLVLGDFRLSLGISAELAGVPYANLCNAHWSPRTALAFPVPELPVLRHAPRLLAPLMKLGASAVFRRHASDFNALRRRHGQAPVEDLRAMYTLGTWTLFADLPELAPCSTLAPHERYLGPVVWGPDEPLPAGLLEGDDARPLVYATLGASGTHRVVAALLEALGALPVRAVLATAGRPIAGALPSNVKVLPYVAATKLLPRAAACVFNGGCATGYQALAAGVPLLALPENGDQFLFTEALVRQGAGRCVRPTFATPRAIRENLAALIEGTEARRAARGLRARIASGNAGAAFRRFLGEVFSPGVPDSAAVPQLASR